MVNRGENELQPTQPYHRPASPEKKSSSCLVYGCLIAFLLCFLLVVGGGFTGYWFLKSQVSKHTSDTPAELPTVQFTDEEIAEIESRVEKFKNVDQQPDDLPESLVLTAEEINALIAKNEELRGKVYVTIQDGQVSGDVSIPTDFIPGGKGRYFNASAVFNVSLENGVLIVTLANASVNGEPVPEQIVEGIGKENLAQEVYKDPEVAKTLRRFESLRIEEDRIILVPFKRAAGSSTGSEVQEPAAPPAAVDQPAGAES